LAPFSTGLRTNHHKYRPPARSFEGSERRRVWRAVPVTPSI
jgi:hypothetical protein